MKLRDLGLSYEAAVHGIQSAIAYDMKNGGRATEPKHMRVGVDTSKAEMAGLATILIEKGVFTVEEYVEVMRRAVNEEVAMREAEISAKVGRKVDLR
ncbi:MAG: hypothetical protein V4773_11985 [Verrucomicrobiota bacterium]